MLYYPVPHILLQVADLDVSKLICYNCNVALTQWNMNTVIDMGFWLGSPTNLGQIFDQDLFEYWDVLQKKTPGVSERSFLSGL